MGKRGADEALQEAVVVVMEGQGRDQNSETNNTAATETPEASNQEQHPYAFNVCGPRNVPCINWRDLINSTWNDSKYKRMVIACFIQAVYLLELDRQENRTNETALAPKWWIPFKYKLSEVLIDERDGSIFGAILEWDRYAALSDFVLIRPSGAPRAVLALRGTLLKSQTIRRDIEDDLRFLAWESLKGSVRFSCAHRALKSIVQKYGSSNVCVAGHSLGAGFALQVGKALAKESIFVEAHLFNPPSVSLASSLRNVGDRAGIMLKRFRAMVMPPSAKDHGDDVREVATKMGSKQWVPHLYVNNSDYICCYYTDPDDGAGKENSGVAAAATTAQSCAAAKLFVLSKGKQKFLEAHGLEQWWSDELELQTALSSSKLISRQLKSLYCGGGQEQQPA
ncbi:GDSL esterase/lipase At4g10955-like [Andrographis paniculata]|uniref:GDSL esterase/lipase At4g10955-like n=1 Tax=Andrographis paniculata TaxID=175694 RepID=UPI0021E6ECF4|nr:GDSL esterase/lipase At4g10955-like [Andrographis paniculata]